MGDVKCKQESSNTGRPFLIGLTGHILEGVSREPARMLGAMPSQEDLSLLKLGSDDR